MFQVYHISLPRIRKYSLYRDSRRLKPRLGAQVEKGRGIGKALNISSVHSVAVLFGRKRYTTRWVINARDEVQVQT